MWCMFARRISRNDTAKTICLFVKLNGILREVPENIPNVPFTQPLQAMPDDVKNKDSITAYQKLLYKVQEKFCNSGKQQHQHGLQRE